MDDNSAFGENEAKLDKNNHVFLVQQSLERSSAQWGPLFRLQHLLTHWDLVTSYANIDLGQN